MKDIILSIIVAIIYILIIAPLGVVICWCKKFTWSNIKKIYYLLFIDKDE